MERARRLGRTREEHRYGTDDREGNTEVESERERERNKVRTSAKGEG